MTPTLIQDSWREEIRDLGEKVLTDTTALLFDFYDKCGLYGFGTEGLNIIKNYVNYNFPGSDKFYKDKLCKLVFKEVGVSLERYTRKDRFSHLTEGDKEKIMKDIKENLSFWIDMRPCAHHFYLYS